MRKLESLALLATVSATGLVLSHAIGIYGRKMMAMPMQYGYAGYGMGGGGYGGEGFGGGGGGDFGGGGGIFAILIWHFIMGKLTALALLATVCASGLVLSYAMGMYGGKMTAMPMQYGYGGYGMGGGGYWGGGFGGGGGGGDFGGGGGIFAILSWRVFVGYLSHPYIYIGGFGGYRKGGDNQGSGNDYGGFVGCFGCGSGK